MLHHLESVHLRTYIARVSIHWTGTLDGTTELSYFPFGHVVIIFYKEAYIFIKKLLATMDDCNNKCHVCIAVVFTFQKCSKVMRNSINRLHSCK